MSGTRIIRVFVASPSDVERERDSLLGVANEINRICDWLIGKSAIRLEVRRWETDTYPDYGQEPQGSITDQIGEYDIFIGIFWKRLGTPTAKAASGTIDEFQTAVNRREKTGKPHIAFYFSKAPITPPRSLDEAEQLIGMVKFRQSLGNIALVGDYEGADSFADVIRPNLVQILGREFLKRKTAASGKKTAASGKKTAASGKINLPEVGKTVILSELGPEDACYAESSKYVGRAGVVKEAERRGDWLSGTFRYAEPLFPGDNREYSFLQFKVEEMRP